MTGVTPPLGPEQPAFGMTCVREVSEGYCGQPATWHIIWTPDTENSIGCDEHAAEADATWSRYDRHPITEVCTMPDAQVIWSWDDPPGRCVWVVSDETLALAEVVTPDRQAEYAMSGKRGYQAGDDDV